LERKNTNTEKIEIREAKVNDISKINEIYVEGTIDELKLQFPKSATISLMKELNKSKKDRLNGWKKEIKSSTNLWLVAEIKKEVIAFASAELKGKQSTLNFLYVSKQFRRKGIGNKLAKKRITWCRKKGAKNLTVGLFIKNNKSKNNLKKLGFETVAIRMQKKLK
jgi:L-amino acid N-acyltransferase YncA